MHKNPILFSTGVFINSTNHHDHSLLFEVMPKLMTTSFEIFVSDYYAERPDEYAEAANIVMQAKDKDASFPVMHMNQQIGFLISRNEQGDMDNAVALFEFNCKHAVKFGAALLVLHLWGGLPSDKNIETNIGVFPKLKEISDKYGLTLTIENVVCNQHKPLDHLKRMWELYPSEVCYTIDVRHAEFHKSLIETCESNFLWKNNLVRHLHISDYGGGYMDWPRFIGNKTPITFGDVDFDYFFNFLKSIGYSGSITIENNRISDSDDLIYNFNKAYEFVQSRL